MHDLLAPRVPPAARRNRRRDGDVARLEEELSERLGAPVVIAGRKSGGGRLVITYGSLEELDGILARIR